MLTRILRRFIHKCRPTPTLKKELCQKCLSMFLGGNPRMRWSDLDEHRWRDSEAHCFIHNKGTLITVITDDPPFECPYRVEQLMWLEKQRYENAV